MMKYKNLKQTIKRIGALVLAFTMLATTCVMSQPSLEAKAADAITVTLNDATGTASNMRFSAATVTSTKNITSCTITVENGYITSTDYTSADKLTQHKTAIWVFNPAKTQGEVQTFLRNVKFSGTEDMKVTIKMDANVTNIPSNVTITAFTPAGEENPHYYMFVPTVTDWISAYNLAKTHSLMGLKGYLVTITSKEEDQILDNITTLGAWAGGMRFNNNIALSNLDADTANNYSAKAALAGANTTWRWVCGPEGKSGAYVPMPSSYTCPAQKNGVKGTTSGYSGFLSGQPDGYAANGENVLQVHFSTTKHWNDLPWNYTSIIGGYFVEFSEYGTGTTGKVSSYSAANTATMTEKVHDHHYSYTVKGNEVSMICDAENQVVCSHGGQTFRFALETPDMVYYHKEYDQAKIVNQITAITGEEVSAISYYKRADDTLLSAAPVDVGSYYAKVSIGEHTVRSDFEITLDKDNYTKEGLGNLGDENSNLYKPANGNVSTELDVHLTTDHDYISVYKIASLNWNETNHDFDDLVWENAVETWRTNPGTAASYAKYTSPLAMKNNSLESEWAGFYKDLADHVVLSDLTKVCDNQTASDVNAEEDVFIKKIENLPFGTYMILGKKNSDPTGESGISIMPVVVNVIPEQIGPNRDWYVKYVIDAYLKDSDVQIEKTINGEHRVISSIGDKVDFDVTFSLPTLYVDRVTEKAGNNAAPYDYTMYFEDTMSKSFTLDTETGFTFGYWVDKEFKELETDPAKIPSVTYPVFVTDDYVVKTGESKQVTTSDVLQDASKVEALVSNSKYVMRTAPVYTITTSLNAKGETVIRIDFNNEAMKVYLKRPDVEAETFSHLSLRYKGIVNENMVVGTEDNYNKAYIHYERNNTGSNVTEKHDEVYAYTYALNLVKMDGATVDTDQIKYLPDTFFKLYKEVSEEEKAELEAEDLETLKAGGDYYIIEDEENGNRYFKVVTQDLPGTTNDFDGTFKSAPEAQGAEGVTIKGLSIGNYILDETDSYANYNELAESIYFEIKAMTEEQVATNAGSLAMFNDMNNELNENGVLHLDVLNYQGLVLPSTGGMGTLLFTIIGIVVMGLVMVILVVKKRGKSESYYM